MELLRDIINPARCGVREVAFPGTTSKPSVPLPPFESIVIDDEISIATFLNILTSFPLIQHFDCSIGGIMIDIRRQTRPSRIRGFDPSVSVSIRVSSFSIFSPFPTFAGAIFMRTFICPSFFPSSQNEQLMNYLNLFTSVHILKIDHCRHVNFVIRCLDHLHIFPRFRDLTISAQNANVDYELVVQMLNRRRNPTHTVQLLQSFQLNLFDDCERSNGVQVQRR
ncbi:hypothetical protein DFH09DRAFT_1315520 [Mycena vulgaris]|nr:hypothetical protein DFH09DRAFT_1315520 [Mycena vulgaris]